MTLDGGGDTLTLQSHLVWMRDGEGAKAASCGCEVTLSGGGDTSTLQSHLVWM